MNVCVCVCVCVCVFCAGGGYLTVPRVTPTSLMHRRTGLEGLTGEREWLLVNNSSSSNDTNITDSLSPSLCVCVCVCSQLYIPITH